MPTGSSLDPLLNNSNPTYSVLSGIFWGYNEAQAASTKSPVGVTFKFSYKHSLHDVNNSASLHSVQEIRTIIPVILSCTLYWYLNKELFAKIPCLLSSTRNKGRRRREAESFSCPLSILHTTMVYMLFRQSEGAQYPSSIVIILVF